VNAVDHEVHVGVLAVRVRDNEDLVLLQPQRLQHAVGHALHRSTVHGIARIETERQVIYRLFDADVLTRGGPHDPGGELGIVGGKIT